MASRLINIRTVEDLQRLTGRDVPSHERADMQRVMDTFPVRLTPHLLELVRQSEALAAQFLPDPREVTDLEGDDRCFVGLLPVEVDGGLEQMYPDRCIIMPQPTCPAYCRFCFRKFYAHREGLALSTAMLDQALDYVARRPGLNEVLITGGEPILDLGRLEHLLAGLRRLNHIGPIRVACRALVTAPDLLTGDVVDLLRRYQDLSQGRPVEIASHVNHPDEITPPTVDALVRLRQAGLHVYNQTVLLRGINTQGEILAKLLRTLRGHGVETYTIYFSSPVRGTEHLRPSMEEALALKSLLRRETSGRANPHLILTTRVGKLELGVDGWVVEREPDQRHVWVRTPYTLDGFLSLHPLFQLPPDTRLDPEGFMEVRYLDGPGQSPQ